MGREAQTGQTAVIGNQDQVFKTDFLRVGLFALHIGIVAYVMTGWMAETRAALFFYVMLLPMIGMQWLFNHGSSVINNWESRIRTGHWRDTRNSQEGHFLRSIADAMGVHASDAQINVVVVFAMAMFWFAGFFRMMIFLT